MAYLHTCKACVFKDAPCARRETVRAGLRGLGVTSAKFRCDTHAPMFVEGDALAFKWTVYGDDPYDEGDKSYETTFTGAVLCQVAKSARFVVRVDHATNADGFDPREVFHNGDLIIKVRLRDMTKAVD